MSISSIGCQNAAGSSMALWSTSLAIFRSPQHERDSHLQWFPAIRDAARGAYWEEVWKLLDALWWQSWQLTWDQQFTWHTPPQMFNGWSPWCSTAWNRRFSLAFSGSMWQISVVATRWKLRFYQMSWCHGSPHWALHPRTWGERACNGKQMASRTSVSVEKQSELLGKQYRCLRIAELSMVLHETPLNYQSIQAMACIAWATVFFAGYCMQNFNCKYLWYIFCRLLHFGSVKGNFRTQITVSRFHCSNATGFSAKLPWWKLRIQSHAQQRVEWSWTCLRTMGWVTERSHSLRMYDLHVYCLWLFNV